MSPLSVGVVGTSQKENEHRIPIHPSHLGRIPVELRKRMIFETGYGVPFGFSDENLKSYVGGFTNRKDLIEQSDIVVLPKPSKEDLMSLHEGAIHLGWPHCVQGKTVTQTAIDHKLTMIAWEAMFSWLPGGARDLHVFHKNNELAGYCSVIHVLGLLGIDGHYGPRRKAVVLSFGCCSRGAIHALKGRGYGDISVFTQRPTHLVHDQVYGCKFYHMQRDSQDKNAVLAIAPDGSKRPLIEDLASADVIVNGILQDTDHPLMYLTNDEIRELKPDSLIIDVSCDLGMGFPFAKPTTFEEPIFNVGSIHYYAVDHTPSYLWNSATWEVSSAFIPYLETIMNGPEAWEKNETVRQAIEIKDGIIRNSKILSFQNRSPQYPHLVNK